MGNRKRAVLFSLYILPFMLNIALIDFLIPIKYDVVLENLPFFGLLVTLAWLASSFLDFAVGDITDRLGIRKTIQLGVLFSFLGTIIFAFSENFLGMTLGVFIWGLSYIMLTIPADTYLFSEFPKKYYGSAYGWMYFFYDLAYAVAPLLGFVLVSFFGFNAAIIASAILVLFTLPLVSKVRSKGREGVVQAIDNVLYKDGIIKKGFKDIKRMKLKELSLLFNMFICGMWFMVVMVGAPLLFFHGGRNLFHGALLAFAFMIPFALMELVYGRLSNSPKRRNNMIKFGFFSSAVLLFIFYFTKEFYLLLLLAVLITLTTNMAWTSTEVEVSRYLPKGRKGEFMGIFMTGKDLGFDIAPLFYGVFAVFGLKVPFFILGVLILLAWVFFMISQRQR